MKKFLIFIIILLAIIIVAALVFDWGRNDALIPMPDQNMAATSGAPIIFSPKNDETVTSPIQISGKVSGNWFFEGSFPIELLDSNGDVIASATASSPEDWATTSMIDFSATLIYPKATTTDRGLIILKNDNPSGDPARDKKEFIQVILK
jgi:Immunoglobulin-like domain of bacterial spore germination